MHILPQCPNRYWRGEAEGSFGWVIVQQYNALESLADKIVGSSIVGSKRPHDFFEVVSSLRKLVSLQQAMNGRLQELNRIPEMPPESRSSKSQIHVLSVSRLASVEEQLAVKGQVKVLLRIIVGMIFNQKTAVDGNKSFNIKDLQTSIDAQEIHSHVIVKEALAIVDESDEE